MARNANATRDQDMRALELLYMTEVCGWIISHAADALGMTKGAAIGMRQRILKDAEKHDPDGNQNGTMPERWWDQ
ncbi:hypothetical protein GCM10016455_05840 [Aliiroseovarius zhejiangensis]|uniref:Uncharacterized protein n=1 Tax=Aliiroseovarius zhejiangensis TaxID=1632025 RepID=A0ABQ3IMF4_9RHOB|nr:hypothetical protein [Aliiroseovarius zhejiangensis]GHE88543.1 hypothetical protein GCM10016455_05840 [Aliiroseovarius zhejiangensis]